MRFCLLFLLFAAFSAGAQSPSGQSDYVVKAGDTLYKIGLRFGVDPEKIKSVNKLTNNDLRSGQHLQIPGTAAVGFNEMLRKNRTDKQKTGKYHKVQAGETLYRIAAMYDLEVDSLLLWNALKTPTLRTGQVVYLEFERNRAPAWGLDACLLSAKKTPDNVQREIGMGELIEGSSASLKMALHRSAPTGTLIRLYHEGSGKFVTVKVIGQLPDISANRSVMIKITKGAWKELALVNSRFPVISAFRK